jgi:GntR family transcriptional regulator, transcriptional repressor for pyruvate dehydrogenase complex
LLSLRAERRGLLLLMTDVDERVPEVTDDRKLSAFSPIRTRKVTDEIAAVLIDAIRGGLYEPGDMLPRERDLAAVLQVSRAPLREAIGILERAGVVSVRRGNNGGIVVEKRFVPSDILAAIQGETRDTVRSLLEVRRSLELTNGILAARQATDEDFAELRRLVDMLDDLGERPDEFLAVDTRFHVKIGQLTGNPLFEEFIATTLTRLTALRAQYPVGRVLVDVDGLRRQRDMLEAIESGDSARIAEAIDAHLGRLEEHFLGERLPFACSV